MKSLIILLIVYLLIGVIFRLLLIKLYSVKRYEHSGYSKKTATNVAFSFMIILWIISIVIIKYSGLNFDYLF
jgi:uncharacterized membrane protein